MKSILARITETGEFTIIVFSERMILNEDPSAWPKVDCFISFYSTGFPLTKAISYTKMHFPITLNNLEKQIQMRSRLEIYNILDKWRIPRPECIVINHSEIVEGENQIFREEYDFIVYKGKKISKPFIEKPLFSDDHDNWIYYPENIGGGCKKLFRKVGDRSSEYDPGHWKVRKNGTYLYEHFLPTFGTDIKVYTVGPMFAHAEARKSPCLDGKVQRTQEGKEVRYSVMLSYEEKLIAHKIVKAFNQIVCGFDILRTVNGKSVVCDVNGFSFVKGNKKYYNDSAQIISSYFLKRLHRKNRIIPIIFPEKREYKRIKEKKETTKKDSQNEQNVLFSPEQRDELSTVIVIMRHGIRRPKLKLKFETNDHRILSLLSGQNEETRLKSPEELSRLLMKNTLVLENLFMSFEDHSKPLTSDEIHSTCKVLNNHLRLQAFLGDGRGFSGVNRKVQLKKITSNKDESECSSPRKVLVVAKWGGELTALGCEQAEQLGKNLRATLYPGDSEGLLRLHSTFRHDLKIYSSDEGRCQVTSAAFTKGFLDLEGDLGPILVQLVIRDAFARSLLDDPQQIPEREKCKEIIEELLNLDKVIEETDILRIWDKYQFDLKESQPTNQVKRSLFSCGNPYSTLKKLHMLMKELVALISVEQDEENNVIIYQGFRQSLDSLFKVHSLEKNDGFPVSQEILQRWSQLTSSFYNEETSRFVTAKIPDILDNAIYDTSYNLNFIKSEIGVLLFEIYDTIVFIGEFVGRFQYGLSQNQRVDIGGAIASTLIKKLLQDIKYSELKSFQGPNKGLSFKKKSKDTSKLQKYSTVHHEEHIRLQEEEAKATGIKSPWRIVRSRFYVTSASHIQSLGNIFSTFLGNQNSQEDLDSVESVGIFSDLNYLSHIVIRVWEKRGAIPEFGDSKFRLEIFVSKGVKSNIGQGLFTREGKGQFEDRIREIFPLKRVTLNNLNILEFEKNIEKLIKDDDHTRKGAI
ncbi:Phosphoglycerate mutase-like family protein [Cryptosporidium felis]|nr:Phosphoglycerate mutase-like family protein [Cryptosporidium felis]